MDRNPVIADLGGRAAVATAVRDLYERLLSDPIVAPAFAGVDLDRVRRHMTDFLVGALGGAQNYSGRDLADAHARLAITDEAFDRVAAHLMDSFTELGVEGATVDAVAERLGPLRAHVVQSSTY